MIYFTSDAHLGSHYHPDASAVERRLVAWLDAIAPDAEAIYFLGDMFDYWFEYRHVVPKGYVRFLGKVAELADKGLAQARRRNQESRLGHRAVPALSGVTGGADLDQGACRYGAERTG